MTVHDLKISERWFDAVANGIKRCEIRRADRDFKVGDTLLLKEIRYDYTVRTIEAKILHIVTYEEFPEGIREGYCLLSIEVIA